MNNTTELFSKLIKVLKSNGNLKVATVTEQAVKDLEFLLKTTGYINVSTVNDTSGAFNIVCKKPAYEIGSQNKLNLQKKEVASVWKLDDTVDEDIIDPDNLLDEEDLKKPDPASLRGNTYLFFI